MNGSFLKQMHKVILSFDYEIYFDGKNDYQSLIDNTNTILSIAKMHRLKCVFFIDSYYLIQLQNVNLTAPYDAICKQIKQMQAEGHEVQYHFHPHWVNAVFDHDQQEWQFDKSEYSYSDLVNRYGVQKANEAFETGLKIFEQICAYKPIAFRAGGLSIQGAEQAFIDVLKQHQFKYDSSVFPNLIIKSKYLNIDHQAAPIKDQWYIDESFLKVANQPSGLIEIPLMMLNHLNGKLFFRAWNSFKYRFLKAIETKKKPNRNAGKPMDLQIVSTHFPNSITFDLSSGADSNMMKYYTQQFFFQKRYLMCLIAHPKSMDTAAQLVMNRYCQWLSKKSYKVIGFTDLN